MNVSTKMLINEITVVYFYGKSIAMIYLHSKHLSNIRNLKRKIPRILPPSPGHGPVERYAHFRLNSFEVRHPRDDDNLEANVKIKLSFNCCA